MLKELNFRLFKEEDFPEYLSWFQDDELNQQLGPMKEDDEWLTYVLNEQRGLTDYDGRTYSIFQNDQLVCVMGVAFPDKEDPYYVITSIAVNPDHRSRGIGKRVLHKVMQLHPLKEGQRWRANVGKKNGKAKLFFEKNGWICINHPSENSDMFLYEFGKR